MTQHSDDFKGMTLFTHAGERKYLNQVERARFLAALPALQNPCEQSFCEIIFWSGCRPTEARSLTAMNFDLDEDMVIIRSLKKRGKQKNNHFRTVPLPPEFVERLEHTHGIRSRQLDPATCHDPLWRFSRTKGWDVIRIVMTAAQITGVRANARGLRHSFGILAALKRVPETRLQSWLGHSSLEITGVYVNAVGAEDRAIAQRMWA